MIDIFHFLRPWWFVALIPAILIFIFSLKKSTTKKSNWAKYCDPHLLQHLLDNNITTTKTWLPYVILTIWLITITALAGPTWSRYAQPIYQKNTARVIALDVSPAMNANDIAPTRMERAKYKVLDLLQELKEAQTGMIVFSSDAFVVSPLTSDSNTIASMVPVLDTTIVPVQGSDIKKALQKSAKLLNQAGNTQGEILLITASNPSPEAIDEAKRLARGGYTTSVLAIGTAQGGPITKTDGSLATDNKGDITFANLDSKGLEQLSNAGNGSYVAFSNDNSDLNQLLNQVRLNNLKNTPTKTAETKNLWRDEGHWLIWLVLILVVFLARKGWLEKLC